MLTLRDCLDFADIPEEEIRVIAEQHGVHEVVATAMGSALLESDEGISQMKRFLLNGIYKAEGQGRGREAHRLQSALARLEANHPHCKPAPLRRRF